MRADLKTINFWRLHFDDVSFRAENERHDFVAFALWDFELIQRGGGMLKKNVPIALADAHALVGKFHVAPGIIHRATGRGTEKIHEELAFPLHAVLPTMLPEAAQLWVGLKAVHQIVAYGGNGVITAQAFVQCFRAHGVFSNPVRCSEF